VTRESWQQLGKPSAASSALKAVALVTLLCGHCGGKSLVHLRFDNFNSFKMFFQQSQCEGPRRIHRMKRKVVALSFCPEPCLWPWACTFGARPQGDISDILRYLLRRRMAIKCQGLQFSEKNCCIRRGSFESTTCSMIFQVFQLLSAA